MGKYFGTDGIRGVVNADLDSNLAYRVGVAAAMVLGERKHGKPFFTIGKDTRVSGDMLEAAIIAGLCSAGADVMCLGVVPTPAVAYITKDAAADAGIVISASHNPFEYNGIKIFSADGFKLSDELEERIEELLDHPEQLQNQTGAALGRVTGRAEDFISRYIDHLAGAAQGKIAPLRVIIDCANGAAVRTARAVFSRFPLSIELICDNPDGININDGCGSTHMDLLSRMVVAGRFDLGLAFDGDADRCLAVDEKGSVVDGDKIMAICGKDMDDKGLLKQSAIVATVMSNLGLHRYAGENGLQLVCTNVGDRQVLERMQASGYNLGGEQSGHLIFLDDATTGDGQLAAVKLLSVLSQKGRPLSELTAEIQDYPQTLENVVIEGGLAVKNRVMENEELKDAVAKAEADLGSKGRILVRPSGTEALIRVMVEAENPVLMSECVDFLVGVVKRLAKTLSC